MSQHLPSIHSELLTGLATEPPDRCVLPVGSSRPSRLIDVCRWWSMFRLRREGTDPASRGRGGGSRLGGLS